MNFHLMNGDCLESLKQIEDNSVDSLVTDPPAGISFMGKEWDDDKGGRDAWVKWMTQVMTESLRVLKPGAHGLVWALPRTSHWTATALEDAGFEVRDVVTHLFGTGFPKSMDISKAIDKAAGAEREVLGLKKYADGATYMGGEKSGRAGMMSEGKPRGPNLETAPSTEAAKQWAGWGTVLKPASEHWILVRKPCSERTVAANVLKHGVGGINIDASRISGPKRSPEFKEPKSELGYHGGSGNANLVNWDASQGRFPANLILDEEAAAALDEQSGICKSAGKYKDIENAKEGGNGMFAGGRLTNAYAGEVGGASRFFYVAKASKADKGEGNTHPTVKSTALMSYLIKLVTPPGGVVLDPFMGSGTTGVAALADKFLFIGIEKEDNYYSYAKQRIESKQLTEAV